MTATAVFASACGRVAFDPTGDATPGPCNWVDGPRLSGERLRDDLSTPMQDSDPFLVRGDPLRMTLTRPVTGSGFDLFMANRPSLDAAFEPAVLITDLSTPDSELALQMDSPFHGYFVRDIAGDSDLIEVQRLTARFTIVRALDEINDTMKQYDPHATADGLSLWFADETPSAGQDIMIARRPDVDSMWTSVEPFPYNTAGGDAGATLTDDELVVVWTAPAAAGIEHDIYYATRAAKADPWSAPRALALAVDQHELEPSIRGDGCELFFVRSPSFGDGTGWDIYSVDIE